MSATVYYRLSADASLDYRRNGRSQSSPPAFSSNEIPFPVSASCYSAKLNLDAIALPPPGSSVSADRADRTGDLPRGQFPAHLEKCRSDIRRGLSARRAAGRYPGLRRRSNGRVPVATAMAIPCFRDCPRLPATSTAWKLTPSTRVTFEAWDLTDADGRQWQFRSEGWVGVSVGHLKDHQIHGTTVTVWYEGQPGKIQLARFVGD